MARIKIKFPEGPALFRTELPVRISDINYGNHLGNDSLLSLLHEARVRWLASLGMTELNTGDHGLIMADAAISYKAEAFYGEMLSIELFKDEVSAISFELLYKVSTNRNESQVLIAAGKTGMVCYDYEQKMVAAMSQPLLEALETGA